MLRGIGSVVSFLTIIPAGAAGLETVARNMYLFPAVGMVVGLAAGMLGYGLSEAGLDPLVIGLLVTAAIAILTGMHHTDGLADLADGMMARGTKRHRLAAMRDTAVGTSGVAAIVLYMIGMVAALSMAGGIELFKAILFAEITAKFSMVVMASVGRSAAPGSNSPFVYLADGKKLALAAAITLVPLMLLDPGAGLVMFAVGITAALFLVGMATRSIGGITGDVLGATNELSRLAAILVFVSI